MPDITFKEFEKMKREQTHLGVYRVFKEEDGLFYFLAPAPDGDGYVWLLPNARQLANINKDRMRQGYKEIKQKPYIQ